MSKMMIALASAVAMAQAQTPTSAPTPLPACSTQNVNNPFRVYSTTPRRCASSQTPGVVPTGVQTFEEGPCFNTIRYGGIPYGYCVKT
jgi:hypothetical protein